MSDALPRRFTRQELAVLDHPDRQSPWVVLLAAELDEPITRESLEVRLSETCARVPMIGARRASDRWVSGSIGSVRSLEQLIDIAAPFALDDEPPLRVALDGEGRRLGLAAHHAAFDGLGLVGIVAALVGTQPPPRPRDAGIKLSTGESNRSVWSRLLRPADRIVPNASGRAHDALAAMTFTVSDHAGETRAPFSARLAVACVAAATAHNERAGGELRRVSVSIGVAGTGEGGNTASYRRIDLQEGNRLAPIVAAGLTAPREPRELSSPRLFRVAGPLLRPIVRRFGDTLLVSNLGRLDIAGVQRIDFYPVARGPSAVAFGAATVLGGDSVLTIRARDLDDTSAEELLRDTVRRLTES